MRREGDTTEILLRRREDTRKVIQETHYLHNYVIGNVQIEEMDLCVSPLDEMNTNDSDSTIISFIVRVWLEEVAIEDCSPIWRGHIRCIPNGKRHYFKNIREIPALIAAHLKMRR